MGAIALFERPLIRERQQEDIKIAKKKGVYMSRKPVDATLREMIAKKIEAGVLVAHIARELKIGRTIIYKYLKDAASKK